MRLWVLDTKRERWRGECQWWQGGCGWRLVVVVRPCSTMRENDFFFYNNSFLNFFNYKKKKKNQNNVVLAHLTVVDN